MPSAALLRPLTSTDQESTTHYIYTGCSINQRFTRRAKKPRIRKRADETRARAHVCVCAFVR